MLLFGDAQFYDENEEPCKERRATMAGIVLRGGKNKQFGRHEIRYQFATGDPLLCPVRGLAWHEYALQTGPTRRNPGNQWLVSGRIVGSRTVI